MKTKRTWQPKKLKRLKKHGFLTRMASSEGAKVIKRRRSKGRKKLAVTISKK
jgi:large subunit ribosomal protein L34